MSTHAVEIVTKLSPWSVDETVSRLSAVVAARGMKLFAIVDHSGEAEAVGLELRNTKLVIFGSPQAGTPVMQAAPMAALDLPLKVLVWTDGHETKLSYTTPEGPEESTLDVSMAADGSLSGSTTGKRGTANIISGYLSADKFSFTVNIPIEGSPTDVVFSGTFDGTALKGVISVSGMGIEIDFTGSKPGKQSIDINESQVREQGEGQ